MSDSVRDEVRAAFARRSEDPLRSCPRCGREERTSAEVCPQCGWSYFARSPAARRRRRLMAAAAALVVLAGMTVAVVALLADRDDKERRRSAERAQRVREEVARLRRIQAPQRGAARALRPPAGASRAERLAARHDLVLAVEGAITAEARRRANSGELKGPITHSECGPFLRSPDAVPDDTVLGKPIGRFDCVAVKTSVEQRGDVVGKLGYPWVAALDFRHYTYVICRNTPAQSEGGKALAFVRLDRACLAAKGRAIGSGYVDPDA